jgi:hypothetical protein
MDHRGRGTDAAYPALDALPARRIDQVDLVEQDDIGKRNLLECDRAARSVLFDVARIHQRNDRVQRVVLLQLLIDEERLRHRPRIGESGGLDQHRIEAVAALAQLPQDPDQVAAHGAADAAVAGLEDLLIGADHQFLVDPDLAEFVFDHGDALAVILGQDAIHQRGLASTQESGEHRDRYARLIWHLEACRAARPRPGCAALTAAATSRAAIAAARAAAAPRHRRPRPRRGAAARCAPVASAAALRCRCESSALRCARRSPAARRRVPAVRCVRSRKPDGSASAVASLNSTSVTAACSPRVALP